MQRSVVVSGYQREADVSQHPRDHPAEGRILVAHMGHHTVAVEIVVLDAELRPLLDVALRSVGHADEHDIAQVEAAPWLQRAKDPRQRDRLPEVRQMMQRELTDYQVIRI